MFISPDVVQQMDEATQIHADGTFWSVPHLFYQLFSIHVKILGILIQFLTIFLFWNQN